MSFEGPEPTAGVDCSSSDTVFVLLSPKRFPISRIEGWYVFSRRYSTM